LRRGWIRPWSTIAGPALPAGDRDERGLDGQERWQTIGYVAGSVILIVAHTVRDGDAAEEIIRIISARKATARERRAYEQAYR